MEKYLAIWKKKYEDLLKEDAPRKIDIYFKRTLKEQDQNDIMFESFKKTAELFDLIHQQRVMKMKRFIIGYWKKEE